MKTFFLIIFTAVLTLLFSCSKDTVGPTKSTQSNVQVQISFNDTGSGKIGFAKPATVSTLQLTVTGPGMSKIEKTGTVSGNTATITVSVPKGDSRKFTVTGIDANSIVQFQGSETENIDDDTESISIDVDWIPPEVLNYSFSELTPFSAKITWSQCQANDFAKYLVLFSEDSDLDPNNAAHRLQEITTKAQTTLTVTGLTSETKYYYAVIAIDTENLFNPGYQPKSFTTLSSTLEISYDDDSQEDALRGGVGTWLTVQFEAPVYPVKIVGIRMNIFNNSFGNELNAIVYDETDVIFSLLMPATADGWVDITPDWSSVPSNGVVSADFDLGLEYLVDNGPFLGADTNSTYQQRSWFRDASQNWFPLDQVGFAWNLMIRALVEIQPGKVVELQPSGARVKERKHQLDSSVNWQNAKSQIESFNHNSVK